MGGLSTASNLSRHNIEVSDKDCIHGCNSEESDNHLFFHCDVAKALWFSSPWSIKWDTFAHLSVEEKTQILSNPTRVLPVHASNKEDFFLFAALILDQLWKIRNSVKMKNNVFSIEKSMNTLHHRFTEFKLTLSKERIEGQALHYIKGLWKKPPTNVIKLNSDAVVKDGICFVGIVTWDYTGKMLAIKAA